jgi:hypothetical protein
VTTIAPPRRGFFFRSSPIPPLCREPPSPRDSSRRTAIVPWRAGPAQGYAVLKVTWGSLPESSPPRSSFGSPEAGRNTRACAERDAPRPGAIHSIGPRKGSQTRGIAADRRTRGATRRAPSMASTIEDPPFDGREPADTPPLPFTPTLSANSSPVTPSRLLAEGSGRFVTCGTMNS